MAVEKCLELDPELPDCYQTRATLVWTLPNHFPYASGIADLKHALTLNPKLDEAEQQIADIYNHIGSFNKAMHWLRRAAEEGFPCFPLFNTDPFLANLRDDSRYKSLMSELKSEWKHNEEVL